MTSIIVESGNQNYDSRNNCNAIVDNNNQLIAGCKNTIIPNSVTSIGGSAFYGCSGLTSINIPDNVTSIGDYAFYGCSGLTSITIPNSVTTIGEDAFGGCWGLTSVTIGNSVTSIGDGAFYLCSGLTSITIPDNVTSIGSSAFSGCRGLVYITLPSKLTSVGSYCFNYCNNLTDIYCNAENVPSANDNSFYNTQNISLYVPYESLDAYKTTVPWNVFKSYRVISSTDTQESQKCSKPKISIVGGRITFDCETPYVYFHWSISSFSGTNGEIYNSSINLLPITINVYATKDGYQNSEVATYMFSGLVGDVDGDGLVNVADHVKLSEIIMNQ